MSGVTSWASELPSGRNPFWIKDEALADLGLHAGDAVGVDTAANPEPGDLVLAEVETDDLADRLVRRYLAEPDGSRVRLLAASTAFPELVLEPDQLIILGVVRSRVRFESGSTGVQVSETPL